ncbi:DMT family transporter [Cognatiyoonia sp.]|uniref:DMT family transporter n=1 Tax=Cognatiyoonia sp. TaxID=2211652 RepID=UPI003F69771C
MRLLFLTTVVMIAFASNSVLSRIGVFTYGMDPFAFAALRVAAGAAILAALVIGHEEKPPVKSPRSWAGAVALATYMVGFSSAYLQLDAGLGALILFGVMQVAMFAFAVARRDVIPMMRWIGAGVALVGLTILLRPGGSAPIHGASAFVMAIAGLGWAAYTLIGQKASDPLSASAANFLLCLPVVAIVWVLAGSSGVTFGGAVAAVISGAITSGLGYALWYRVVPQLSTTVAAVAQLSVPVIAVVAGVILLAEPLTSRLLIAGALVLGGIGLSLIKPRSVHS